MRIHHLALRTHDLHRLERFYTERLGLEIVRRQPGYSVWLQSGAAVVMLEQAETDEPEPPGGSRELIAFAVSDLTGMETKLVAGGVTIEDRTAHTLYFRDPDGRRIGVSDYAFD